MSRLVHVEQIEGVRRVVAMSRLVNVEQIKEVKIVIGRRK